MASPLLDYKDWQHVKSDAKSTTLQHKKHKHMLTLAHDVLSKPHQTQLKALANIGKENETNSQAQEAQDQQPRKAMAEGGPTMSPEMGDGSPMPMMAEGGPCLNPNCSSSGQSHPNCKCYGGMAEGGKPKTRCDSRQAHDTGCELYAEDGGISPQGKMIRHNTDLDKRHAKDEAKGRMEHERMIKPKMQNLAEGGEAKEENETQIRPDKGFGKVIRILAEGGEVLHEGPMTPQLHKAMGGTTPSESRAMYAEGEDVQQSDADPNQVMTPVGQGQKQTVPGVNININSGPAPQQAPSPEPPPETGAQLLRHRMADAGNFIRKAVVGEPIGPDGMPVAQPQAEQPQPQGMAPQRTPAAQPQQPQAVAQPSPQPQPQPQASPSMPMASAPPSQIQQPDPFTQTRDASIAAMQDDKNSWGQDLKDGHVSPKTYESLFADKSTTGKIGTIFGMLLSGAGSGLAHQSNAMFDIMNQQIQRDLQAQEKSKDNAQNYLRLAQQHELNKSQSKVLNADAALKTKALANIFMNQSALHTLVQQANKLPVGSPEWQKAQQGLAMLSSQIDNADLNLMDRAAIGSAQFNALAPTGTPSTEEGFNQQQKQRLLMGPKGQALEQYSAGKHVPGYSGEASRNVESDEQKKLVAQNILDKKVREVIEFAATHRGSVDPGVRRLAAQKAHELTAFYNGSIDNLGMSSGRLNWLDEQIKKNPTSIIEQVLGNQKVLREIRDSNNGRRDEFLRSVGINPNKKTELGSQEQETIKRRDPQSGRTVIYDAKTKKPLRFE